MTPEDVWGNTFTELKTLNYMAQNSKKEVEEEEPTEEYPKYIMEGNTINITVKYGGTVIFQSGSVKPPPPPPGGG